MSATSAAPLAPYQVQAYNTAKESENKIHDDSIARKFGFTGGLVPGVDVYAYMTHLPVQRWGRDWLERGTAECRFGKPVYDGETATVTARETPEGSAIVVESQGHSCAVGTAALPAEATAPPAVESYRIAPPPADAARPPASETSLAPGAWINSQPIPVTPEFAAQYLEDLRETDPLYAREGLAHPGLLLRMCNRVLGHNVVLGPWIHVGSVVHHHGLAHVGETLTARARIAGNYERKGHRFVDLDALVLADGRPVAHVLHTAIWLPRQLAAA
jgi:acyl dehydratase